MEVNPARDARGGQKVAMKTKPFELKKKPRQKFYLISRHDETNQCWVGIPKFNSPMRGKTNRIMIQLATADPKGRYRILESDGKKQVVIAEVGTKIN